MKPLHVYIKRQIEVELISCILYNTITYYKTFLLTFINKKLEKRNKQNKRVECIQNKITELIQTRDSWHYLNYFKINSAPSVWFAI